MSRDLAYLGPDDDVDRAVQLVRERAVRRIPIVEEKPQLGWCRSEIWQLSDERSALADVSAAPPNE